MSVEEIGIGQYLLQQIRDVRDEMQALGGAADAHYKQVARWKSKLDAALAAIVPVSEERDCGCRAGAPGSVCATHRAELLQSVQTLSARNKELEAAVVRPDHTLRWNVRPDFKGDGVTFCRGEHERSEACIWERWVPEAALAQALQAPNPESPNLRQVRDDIEYACQRGAGGLDLQRKWLAELDQCLALTRQDEKTP